MIKFKRQNIMQLAKETETSYLALDLLRQTTIERLVKIANKNNMSEEDFKNLLKTNTQNLIDLMIQ